MFTDKEQKCQNSHLGINTDLVRNLSFVKLAIPFQHKLVIDMFETRFTLVKEFLPQFKFTT